MPEVRIISVFAHGGGHLFKGMGVLNSSGICVELSAPVGTFWRLVNFFSTLLRVTITRSFPR